MNKKERESKPSLGRPTKYGKPMRKWYQRLPDDVIDFCRRIGTDAVVRILRKAMSKEVNYDKRRI